MKKRIIAIILAALMLLTACGKASDTPAPTDDTQPTSESMPTQSTDAPTEPTSAPTEPAATEPTPAPTESESNRVNVETITKIGTYENLENELTEYEIYTLSVDTNKYFWYRMMDIDDERYKQRKEGTSAFVVDGMDVAMVAQDSLTDYDGEIITIYAFGSIYHLDTPFDIFHNRCHEPFMATEQMMVYLTEHQNQAYLFYPDGCSVVYLDENKEASIKIHENGESNIRKYENEEWRRINFAIENNTLYYYRFNTKYCHSFSSRSQTLDRQDSQPAFYATVSDEELDNTFMLEYGTIKIIDGVPQLHPIQTYTVEEWSHSRFCGYAEKLEQYGCRINELEEILQRESEE